MPYWASRYIISILTIFLVLLNQQTAAQSPVANFTANRTSGCSPLIVQFTDQSTGSPTSWHWDLGNGSTSTIQNPTATYITPGSYTITLIATNANGSNTVTKTDYIVVLNGPDARFTSTDTSGCTPLLVNFTDQSVGVSGTITQWEWNFGDGATSTVQNPSHTYTVAGTFNVYLKVTNTSGCSQTVFKQQYIHAGSGATADFIANVPSSCTMPVTVSFSNRSQADASSTYFWDFGDGNTSSAINPSHSYTQSKNYVVKLTVKSPDGCTSTKQQTIGFSSQNVVINGPDVACAGAPASFTISSNQPPLSQRWDMGDGQGYTTPAVTHTYLTPTVFVITLTTEFPGGCISVVNKQVKVTGGPSVDFTADTTKACRPPFAVNFTATGTASTFQWDFGDGSNGTQKNTSHTYQSAGTFTVQLTAVDSIGCSTRVQKPNFVAIQPPTVAISNLPVLNGCTPYSFLPVANVTAIDGVASYFWDFGDGTTSTLEHAGHTYRVPGLYTVKLRIQTKGGCIDSAVYNNAVKINQGDSINLTATPLSNCIDRPIHFEMFSGTTPSSLVWFFGDMDSSTMASPDHSYKSAGLYDITLVVRYGNCESRLTKDKYVEITPPEAKFSAVRDCNNKLMIHFKNESLGTGTLNWNFGDGGTSNAENPDHTYTTDGTYTVSLTIDNGSCSHTLTKQVEVSSSDINLSVAPAFLCKNAQFTLKAIVPNTVDASGYQWVIGTQTLNTNVDTAVWSVSKTGSFDVTLTLTSKSGCVETVTKPSALTVYGPTAKFGVDKSGGCINTTINFQDSSATDGTHPITQWEWDFGDTVRGSGAATSHTFTKAGYYSIVHKVVDNFGCADSIYMPAYIRITSGKAMFFSNDSFSCRGKTVAFTDTSHGTISFWDWDFGDGQTSSGIQHPVHTYADSGVYTVKLRIIENSGCADSITKTNYVTIRDPKAAFVVSDTFSSCPPLTARFTDKSYWAAKWKWDFADGGGSSVANPVNLYNIPNTYRVKLVITSPGGCTDSAFTQIRILGPYGQFKYTPLSGCTPLNVNYTVGNTDAVKFLWDYSDGVVDSGRVSTSAHTYLSGGRFVPKVILTDSEGCSVPIVGTDTIYIEKVRLDFNADSTAFCDTATVHFTNTSIQDAPSASYEWSFGDGTGATGFNTSHTYTSPSWYDVTLRSMTSMGCVDSLTKSGFIHVNNSPVATIVTNADSLCVPASFQFSGQLQPDTSGIKTWQWQFGNGQTSNLQSPPPQQFTVAGSYQNTLYVEDNQGCHTTVSKTVSAEPLPVITVSNDTTICRGATISLAASGGVRYQWLQPNNGLSCTDCANPNATPDFNIQYKVQGSSAFGCVSQDSVFITVIQPFQLSVAPVPDSLCLNRSVQLKASGAPFYTWTPATGLSATNISNPVASPQVSTVYQVVGYDTMHCFVDSALVTIRVMSLPTVDAGPDLTLSAGSSAVIQATASPDAVRFTWTPVTGLTSPNSLNPTVTAGSDQTYTIKVANASGCTAQDQMRVIVTCGEGNIFVPNTFSPNGDGMNDVFYVRGKGIYAIRSLRIFNRWGEMVFEKKDIVPNDPNSGWNGIYKGASASADTYVYQLEVLCSNTQLLQYSGTISLIR